jgi:hypothetical protein
MQDFNLARDLALFARVLRRAEGGRRVIVPFPISVVVTIANMLGQVRLNERNRLLPPNSNTNATAPNCDQFYTDASLDLCRHA